MNVEFVTSLLAMSHIGEKIIINRANRRNLISSVKKKALARSPRTNVITNSIKNLQDGKQKQIKKKNGNI